METSWAHGQLICLLKPSHKLEWKQLSGPIVATKHQALGILGGESGIVDNNIACTLPGVIRVQISSGMYVGDVGFTLDGRGRSRVRVALRDVIG